MLVYFEPHDFQGFLLLLIQLLYHFLDFCLVILQMRKKFYVRVSKLFFRLSRKLYIIGHTSMMFFFDIKSLYSSSAFSNIAITFLLTLFSRLQAGNSDWWIHCKLQKWWDDIGYNYSVALETCPKHQIFKKMLGVIWWCIVNNGANSNIRCTWIVELEDCQVPHGPPPPSPITTTSSDSAKGITRAPNILLPVLGGPTRGPLERVLAAAPRGHLRVRACAGGRDALPTSRLLLRGPLPLRRRAEPDHAQLLAHHGEVRCALPIRRSGPVHTRAPWSGASRPRPPLSSRCWRRKRRWWRRSCYVLCASSSSPLLQPLLMVFTVCPLAA